MNFNPLHFTDAYKLDHRRQYPEGTELVYSNWTPRGSRINGINSVVLFALQYFIKEYLIRRFNRDFFEQPVDKVLKAYARRVNNYLGENSIGTDHIMALHELGYLPIEIKAIPEGMSVPLRVPMFTVKNTIPEFFWLTNYFETLISTTVWMGCNSATIAKEFRKILNEAAEKTGGDMEFVPFQGHDFSMRGMGGLEAAMISAAGHLLSFCGGDTIPAVDFLEEYYNADSDKELVGVSVAATEHSVMCMGGDVGEFDTFKRLITEVYPKGIVSIVCDTWNIWDVLNIYLPKMKNEIIAREGKVVIRHDSGDPVEGICGTEDRYIDNDEVPNNNERAACNGVIQTLWDIFGGTETDRGYKVLDEHIGAIYGDAITMDRAREISSRLEKKGFASTNLVYGIGSYTYQYNTRDTFGFAMKATYGEVNGEGKEIFKDPVTDDGLKKSARGLLHVMKNEFDGEYQLVDQVTWEVEGAGELIPVYRDGKLLKDYTLAEIRENILL